MSDGWWLYTGFTTAFYSYSNSAARPRQHEYEAVNKPWALKSVAMLQARVNGAKPTYLVSFHPILFFKGSWPKSQPRIPDSRLPLKLYVLFGFWQHGFRK